MPDALVWRDAFSDELHDRFGLRRLPQYDDRLRNSARFLVGTRNNGGVRNTWMCHQHGFQLSRRHLQTFVLDQLLGAIDDEEVPVFVGVTDVAGVQPTVG